jgi:CubicO group peptidase (beta-lactamase class C family)
MRKRQFRVLYRDFLFRVVDREMLSTYAKGDASQLLLQIIALLAFLSVIFCIPALGIDFVSTTPVQVRLMFAWSIEHFLIATTMLVVGMFAVLSWDSMFPGHRDVLVLAPLPIRAHTILLAKAAAVATALGLAVFTLHVAAGLVWPLALNAIARGHAVRALALTSDSAMPPVAAADLQAVLDRDLADAIRNGHLAPNAGGGVSVGIYQHGARRIFAYGAAAPDSIFQIGSITKPFTGLLLAKMVQQGIVEFDQPVRQLVPAVGLHRRAENEITLLDLATHHSGLPAMPVNFHPADPANPYADYDAMKLYAYLANRGFGKVADLGFRYSNLGFGLLGHALGNRAGVDYATLVRQSITGPLGMNDTVVALSPEQRPRFLQGYNDERQQVPPWDLDVLAGAGGLRSTAPDMLTWLEANLHPERLGAGPLSAALVASHQVRARLGSNLGIALAWMFHADTGNFEHGGATVSFTADAFFNPKDDLAVIVLSNVGPGTAVSADVLGEHLRARLVGRPAVALEDVTIPATGGVRSWIRLLTAYWLTMIAAGVFIFGLAMSAQGIAASLLPRRYFLRLSSFLQLGAFCLVVGVYVLQPMVVTGGAILAAQQRGILASSPSYWFLGLFQELSGSPAFAPLARSARIGLGLVVFGAAIAYALSYVRTLRRIAEQPDIAPAMAHVRWLPLFGDALQTAIVQFSIRTLFRSAPHRVILAFYWGIGFALAIIFLKSPGGQQFAEVPVVSAWHETSVPLLVSSMVMMAFAVLAARLAFAMPRDLPANWIFRVVPVRGGSRYVAARRRALIVVSAAPVWIASAAVFVWIWPWRPALGHLVAFALLSMILVEIALYGTQKIPFTCSYLPGRSHVHIAVYVAVVLLLPLAIVAARFERDALQDPIRYGAMVGVLGITWIGVRWRTAWLGRATGAQPEFEDEPAGRVLTLDVWDCRFPPSPAGLTPAGVPLPTPRRDV